MGSVRTALTLGLLAVAACAGSGRPAARLDRHEAEVYTVEVGGRQRSFILAPGPRSSALKPLMLVYHGGGGTAQAVLDQTALGLAAVDAGMAVASLDAAPGTDGRWLTNPADAGPGDDLAFTRAAIALIARDVRIDSSRILAVGFSRGAQFTYQLACRAPGLVRAIVAVAGGLPANYRPWCDASAKVPHPAVILASGTRDPAITAVEASARYWVARNECTGGSVTDTVPARRAYWTVTRTQYAGCEQGDVQFYRVAPLDHQWPGSTFDIEPRLVSWFLALPAR
jgi:polyhydroxybutyrate depolymerase